MLRRYAHRACILRDPSGRVQCQAKGSGQGKRYFVEITSDTLALRKLDKIYDTTGAGRMCMAVLWHSKMYSYKKIARFSRLWLTSVSFSAQKFGPEAGKPDGFSFGGTGRSLVDGSWGDDGARPLEDGRSRPPPTPPSPSWHWPCPSAGTRRPWSSPGRCPPKSRSTTGRTCAPCGAVPRRSRAKPSTVAR